MFNFKNSSITLLLVCAALSSRAQLSTSKLFADHMVLQRNKPVAVWGWGKPRATVAISFNQQQVTAKADAQGNWKAVLKPMSEGGPYEMEISSGNQHLHYSDVMLGEVWICSGQSNMEFQLRNADSYKAEQVVAAQQPVRQFLVPRRMSVKPEKDLIGGSWVKADANTVGDFTAVGYHFAKQLAARLHVTVGLVFSSWGGTQAECWISKEGLLTSPELAAVARNQPDDFELIKKKVERQIRAYAYNNRPEQLYNAQQLAAEPANFFANWQNGTEGAWQWQGKWSAYQGTGFMQRTIKLGGNQPSKTFTLNLGQTNADMEVYVDGQPVFKGELPADKAIDIPAGTFKEGDNSLLINLLSSQKNTVWFGMGLNGDNKNLYLKSADTTINLSGNNWKLMADFSKPYHMELMPNNTVSTLYNGMINPLVPLTVAGMAWYQGETNAGRAAQYKTVLPLMITDWRNHWKEQLPFIIMQLPMWGPTQNSNQGSTWAELREAQAATTQLPNTAMVVTIDLGDPNNLHPTNKAPFGNRLADVALHLAYGQTTIPLSPEFTRADFKQGAAWLSLNIGTHQLIVKDSYGYLKGFELAGADHQFHYAKAEIINNQVRVWCDAVPQPVAVRYAWSDSPVDANLFIKEGLPAAPFRSDNWKGLTDQSKLTD